MPTVEPAHSINCSTALQQSTVKGDSLSPTGISPTQTDKRVIHGIELVQHIVYQGWKPGIEYVKNVVLKNVTVKTQKLKFSSPKTRFFSTLFPKPLTLSAGTSFTLPVTFRPLENIPYNDQITFITKDEQIVVSLQAFLPETRISVPDLMNFEMCAVLDSSSLTFNVINTGDLDTTVEWQTREPFSFEPSEAFISCQASFQFTATFKPQLATVYELEAVCLFGLEQSQNISITLKGTGKYPHLLVSTNGRPNSILTQDNLEYVISFGVLPVGSKNTKWIELHNLSPVRAPFCVEHSGTINFIDQVFDIPIKQGIVPANSAMKIPVSFNPNTVDTSSIDYFHIAAVGNISKSAIKCTGSSKGPLVHLSAMSINFMEIWQGESCSRTVDIINTSDIDAFYQFMIDCEESVFSFQQVSGIVKANSRIMLSVKFTPFAPINFFRRIPCLVHNQGPLFLDLLGTCHAETVKPAVLLSKHIKQYYTHIARGFSLIPPEQLNNLLEEKKLDIDEDGCLINLQNEQNAAPFQILPFEEYFNDGFHSDVINTEPHVSADINLAEFGNCRITHTIDEKIVNITNHTYGKILVHWNTHPDHVFTILQPTLEIQPLKTGSFRVRFQPTAPNKLFGAELECYVYYKSLRDYRMVQDTTHCPPWCLTLTCTGHTFLPNNETFLPQYQLHPSNVVFPAVDIKESTYRTVLLKNTGTTPILYSLPKDPDNIFAVKPVQGLLSSQHQILVIRCIPEKVQIYKYDLTIRLNDNDRYNKVLQLSGSAESPEVLLDCEGCLYFKPTCIGTASKKNYTVKNISRIPLRFQWQMKHYDAKQLKVHPDSGLIQPNESQSQIWSFTPTQQGKFVMKPSLIVWGQGFGSNTASGKKKEFPIRVIAEGALGSIQADQTYIEFGNVMVGSSATKQFTLFNNSTCSLTYTVHVDLNVEGPCEEVSCSDHKGLELDSTSGSISARSKLVVRVTARPMRCITYKFSVFYQLLTPEGSVSDYTVYEPQHLLHIVCTGVYPTIAVTDARCSGSLIFISKKQLWSLFSLDSLNECLDSFPSAEELMYNTATRDSYNRRISVYTRAILDFNFSAAPLGCEPCIVTLLFENTGTVAADWVFLFPPDLHLELEYWAETGDFDADELHEMKIMDNKLFGISPNKGKLEPGATQAVTLTYHHTMAGTDRLPVLLKIARGREILLNFIGVTVEPDRSYIHFASNKYMFTPVPVGEKTSPKQVYELYNGGAVPVKYELDLAPLDIIQKENYDHPIFECLSPVGEIAPGRSVSIEWRFSPLEAKTYIVDIPIHVHNGDTAVITFTGIGYDRRVMGDTMPLNDAQDLSGVPSVQSVAVPGQLSQLSVERISFGNMSLFSQARRIVFVINKSRTHPISFKWHVTSQEHSKILSVTPVRGNVSPEGSCLCRVTFSASGLSSFYDLDLISEVMDDYEMDLYRKELSAWEAERLRQKVEFVITENDLDADKRIPSLVDIVERPPSVRLASLGTPRMATEGELARYKTLPPIQVPSVDEEIALRKAEKKQEEKYWAKPSMPQPFLLHLGLTARTHDVMHFQENFPKEYPHFYIDRSFSDLPKGGGCSSSHQVIPTSISCVQSEAYIISSVLSNTLRGLLNDNYFTESVRAVMKEPVPYFVQYISSSFKRSVSSSHDDSEQAAKEEQATEDRKASADSLELVTETSLDDKTFPKSDTPCSACSSEHLNGVSHTSLSSKESSHSSSPSQEEKQSSANTKQRQLDLDEQKLEEEQVLKKLPEFGNVVETILENTILNVISEAHAGDFKIAARRRFIALPRYNPAGTSTPKKKSGL